MCIVSKLKLNLVLLILWSVLASTEANIFDDPEFKFHREGGQYDFYSTTPSGNTGNDGDVTTRGSSRLDGFTGTTTKNLDAETCRNNRDWKQSTGANFDCGDIHFVENRRIEFCQLEEVHLNCPVACGLCCEDDPDYLFTRPIGADNNCNWLSKDTLKQDTFCDTFNNGIMVRAACPKACGYCKSYISLAPIVDSIAQPITEHRQTEEPTNPSSKAPSRFPTYNPTTKSIKPSSTPTHSPSKKPSSKPSPSPSKKPSSKPSPSPTDQPTRKPSPSPTDQSTISNPNLVMIITDEHNLRTLSCYRDYLVSKYNNKKDVDVWGINRYLDTPNIDSLARDGALFTNFYTASPLCTPSRASFMTGMYPPFTGAADQNHGLLDKNLKTFANILRDERGYLTSYMGKWHL